MASIREYSTCQVPPSIAWRSLVRRSIDAWEPFGGISSEFESQILRDFESLDDFMTGGTGMTFWFFQRREAFQTQKRMNKWSRDRLEDYVIFPAVEGYVSRSKCFFVSHFWHSKDHPDPNGHYLRLLQGELESQSWSYIWTDWTCLPQAPRSKTEEEFFLRSLPTISGIIRNCGFVWFYPPFEARMWILYEVAEYTLTCSGQLEPTEDMRAFAQHVKEMLLVGVRPTLEKYGYTCSYERDKEYLTSWLELLVLLRTLIADIGDIRRTMNHVTWLRATTRHIYTASGHIELSQHEGKFILNGRRYDFTPFPKWDDGKYS